jgi:hypothetical protein
VQGGLDLGSGGKASRGQQVRQQPLPVHKLQNVLVKSTHGGLAEGFCPAITDTDTTLIIQQQWPGITPCCIDFAWLTTSAGAGAAAWPGPDTSIRS